MIRARAYTTAPFDRQQQQQQPISNDSTPLYVSLTLSQSRGQAFSQFNVAPTNIRQLGHVWVQPSTSLTTH